MLLLEKKEIRMEIQTELNIRRAVGRRQMYRRIAKHKNTILKEVNVSACDITNEETHLSAVPECNATGCDNQTLLSVTNLNLVCEVDTENENYNSDNYPSIDINYITDTLSENVNPPTLQEKLRLWAITSSVSKSSVSALLHLLIEFHPDLPLNYRSL